MRRALLEKKTNYAILGSHPMKGIWMETITLNVTLFKNLLGSQARFDLGGVLKVQMDLFSKV